MDVKYAASQIQKRGGFSRFGLTLWTRMAHLVFLRFTSQSVNYSVDSGFGKFNLKFLPTGDHTGSQGYFVFRDKYEHLLEFGSQFLSKTGQAIDGGSNQGIYATAFATRTSGTVVAVEPIPRQVERARANLKLNNLNNAHVVDCALSDAPGEVSLYTGGGDVSASIVYGERDDPETVLKVQAITVDEIVEKFQLHQLELLKLDVEGAELNALRGAQQTLQEQSPVVCLELTYGEQADHVIKFMQEMNYSPFLFTDGGETVPAGAAIPASDNVVFLKS